MVDSGSDVATVTEADLHQLDLELLGTIKSRGVHSTKDKQLYRAKLLVGEEEIETEVRNTCCMYTHPRRPRSSRLKVLGEIEHCSSEDARK
jgi:hypothetical protein